MVAGAAADMDVGERFRAGDQPAHDGVGQVQGVPEERVRVGRRFATAPCAGEADHPAVALDRQHHAAAAGPSLIRIGLHDGQGETPGPLGSAVEAGGVHQAGVHRLLAHVVDAQPRQPGHDPRAASARVHHEVRGEFLLPGGGREADPGHPLPRPGQLQHPRLADHHPGVVQHGPPHRPVEQGPGAGQHPRPGVAPAPEPALGREGDHARAERYLVRAGGEQVLAHADARHQLLHGGQAAGHEEVRVTSLRQALAVLRPLGQIVAVEHDHLVRDGGQGRRGQHAGQPRTDDDSSTRHATPRTQP